MVMVIGWSIPLMQHAYLLNSRSFRENSFIVDLLTENNGRMSGMARVAKKRGKILRGNLQPFALLNIHWSGQGQLPNLTLLEEKKTVCITLFCAQYWVIL